MNNSTTSRIGYASLMDMVGKVCPPPPRFDSLLMHPEAMSEFAESLHPKKWEFPRDRFVEYEASDEEWARPVRYGREVDDTSRRIAYALNMAAMNLF